MRKSSAHQGAKWLEVRDGEKRTAFVFAKLLDRHGFGEEADKRRLKRLAMGLLLNGKCDRRIEHLKYKAWYNIPR